MEKEVFTKERLRQKIALVAILLLYALALSSVNFISLLQDGTLLGKELYQDTSYHLMRLQSIADGLRGGQFPVKVYPNALNGYGYASPLFYPDFFLYLPAVWMLLGMPLGWAYACFLSVLLCLTAIFYYLFARRFFAPLPAAFAAGMFVSGNYTYSVFFYMNAVGQASAACFSPLVMLGVYNMLKEDFSKPWILLVAMLGVTYSHTISLFLWALFLVVLVLVNAKKLFADAVWWKKTLLIFGAYLLMSVAYLLPLAEQMLSADFYHEVAAWAKLSNQATHIGSVFLRFGVPLTSAVVEYSVGLIVVACFVLRFFIRKTEENAATLKLVNRMMIAIVLSQLCATNLFPWKLLEGTIFNSIQFPSRLLMLTAPLTPLCIVLIVREFAKSPVGRIRFPRPTAAVLAAFLLVFSAGYDMFFLPPDDKTVLDLKEIYAYTGGGEWYPIYENAYAEKDGEPIVYVTNTSSTVLRDQNNRKIEYERAENTLTFVWEGEEGGVYTLPLLYYKGYAATDEYGNALPVEADGWARVTVTAKQSGTITLYYKGTAAQTASMWCSAAASVLTLAGFSIASIEKTKKNPKKSKKVRKNS